MNDKSVEGLSRAGGDPIEENDKYLVVLRRQADGTFKIARDMDNSVKPLTQTTPGVR